MNTNIIDNSKSTYSLTGLFTLSLRLVVGWTYFSAFWRRLILENKLIENEAGYIGEKFNHFLPNALGIKPMIEFLVSNPEWLWWAMVIFTIIEAVVGLFIMLGLFTRTMSIGVLGLATGILLGSGWIGTTCLDEWQIGILGVATGFTIFLTGGGKYSLDAKFADKYAKVKCKYLSFLTSGPLPLTEKQLNKFVLPISIFILFLTLFTNQVFHGGVWGKLHNKSVSPIVELSDVSLDNDKLKFTAFRVEGADVYGSFLIGIDLVDEKENKIIHFNGEDLSKFPVANIDNYYVAKIKPGKHSLIIPLGAKADLTVEDEVIKGLPIGNYKLILTDISGKVWTHDVKK